VGVQSHKACPHWGVRTSLGMHLTGCTHRRRASHIYVQTANSNLIMSLWPERLNDEAAENPRSKSEYYGCDSPITFMSTTQPPFELHAHEMHALYLAASHVGCNTVQLPFNHGC
jgi:hypothetical protein